MFDICVDGKQKRLAVIAFEKLDGNFLLAAEFCGPQPVHSVDDPHCAAVHENRRKVLRGRQQLHVLWTLTGQAG
ncbi:hypothetical protein [Phytohabitans houttuyneae]|uniref:hypothetical protein n=1 Tax=Phytohabitans houttuyneae TaxID=1076126 RepID=UPI001FE6D11E|nr:hypothetical protein [Phytohabitans houttuyneae]